MSDWRLPRSTLLAHTAALLRFLLVSCWSLAAALRLSAADAAAPNTTPPVAAATTAAPPPATNTSPKFVIRAYEIRGDTLLSTETLMSILVKYTGTNIGLPEILKAGSELQMEYRERGYPTVRVTIPPQQITDGIVKIRVFEGFLSDIVVTNNHHFSSNNIMRALPDLCTGILLNGPVFQAELDRANANQDRQIYPQIEPGPGTNATRLILDIKDRMPLHAKVELNDQSSPGTPDLRVNASAVYNNLWQYENSLGVQYSFSPESFKSGNQWDFYDLPLVANYSVFCRLFLGNPAAVQDAIASQPGTFGFDEATRKFRLPPSSGRAELTVFASRSTIDTGLSTLLNTTLFSTNGNSLDRQDVQEDVTLNNDIGFRLSVPLPATGDLHVGFSYGLDYKTYNLTSYKTNIFTLRNTQIDYTSDPDHPQTNITVSVDRSPVPTTHRVLQYLPLALHYDASLRDPLGMTALGLGMGGNASYSGSLTNLQSISGSSKSGGRWLVLNPSLSRDIIIYTNWMLSIRADGQWASEPLISNEQFGAGGIASVRGYREGEVFGDTGWHVSLEQKTPSHVVGFVHGRQAFAVRGSVYMDYAETYLLDPQGRQGRVPLWGAGFGGVASIGSHWEARLLFSWPLERTPTTRPNQPRFDFALTAQF